ncbi:MAG: hypothetical protein DKM50_13275 [Candidatus Margulisiibacteriota bacterium]|nr:MAG: hypothetical protein A2X43_13530 [Candidatus Margulisbacteria bacterium GWD2_39_127]OGI05328.1 MAG: hypothetical protein A2X42_05740 [Candidatus Margulisbacteria bacterium GWF2_38_17]OGI06047.1 MAG: hypothetical protein A2X41_06295 [Candidatus Margulisbacteria bacterium GWE2_39_32]PZM77313.1 MAG: hypothetical protein DKM50_13275 [Candidatus Margulisiibacteriota bacterium]HAR62572.1 hypothetical protein [Candidatus Margulisiibacteriota bacterium]
MNIENEWEHSINHEETETNTVANLLNLSKKDIENIIVSEFGEDFKESKGFDNLLNTLIN